MSMLRDARVRKLRKELAIKNTLSPDFFEEEFYTDGKSHNYYFMSFINYFLVEKAFKIEFFDARYPEYRTAKLFFIMPAIGLDGRPKDIVSDKDLIFNVKGLKQYKRMPEEEVALMLAPENYFDYDKNVLYKHYYFTFTNYVFDVFIKDMNLGEVFK